MYGMTNSGKLFSDNFTEWLIDAVLIQYPFQMSVYYKYAPYVTKNVVLSYVDDCVYWCTYEYPGKLFVDALRKRLHVKFLGYANWFMSIIIDQMKNRSISVYQARYDTSIVAKYLYTDTVKTIAKFYKTTLPSYTIFTKTDASSSDEKVENLTRELNIHYRACIGSLIYLLSTRVDLIFSVHKLSRFS